MRILILNWRDIKNPAGGGAEILTHEMAKRWVARGHTVTQFSSRFAGGKSKEEIDGVRIIRRGAWWNVQLFAAYWYITRFKNHTDIIIDEVHWYPFFAALYARKKTVLLACEVARKLFFTVIPYPLALIGRGIEKLYFRLYRDVPTIAISPSTKADLIKEGFNPTNITVIPMGVTALHPLPKVAKEKDPTMIYVGRINKQKGVADAIRAFGLIHKKLPKSRFWIVGAGDAQYIEKMKHLATKLNITNSVRFWGRVSEKIKFRLLARAHVLLFPSLHEGWGLVVHEAGLVGTPTIAYNVAGLKDTIKHRISGVITDPRPDALAAAAVSLLKDIKYYNALQRGAKEEAKIHTWDRTSAEAMQFLKRI